MYFVIRYTQKRKFTRFIKPQTHKDIFIFFSLHSIFDPLKVAININTNGMQLTKNAKNVQNEKGDLKLFFMQLKHPEQLFSKQSHNVEQQLSMKLHDLEHALSSPLQQ